MRGGYAVLLATCLCLAQADRLSFPLQEYVVATGSGMHGAVLFARDEPSLTAFVDSDDFQDSDEDGSPAWLDSELTGDFDGGFQTWLDQQLGMLQALVVPGASPCGGARMAYLQQEDPSISYMASSRFGPAVLTTVMQQIDSVHSSPEEEEEAELADSSAWESVFDGEGGKVMAQPRKAQQFPDWLSAQEVVGQQADASLPRTLFSSLASNIQEAKSQVDLGAYRPPEFSEDEDWGTEHPPPPPPHASCADMMTFAVLTIGCIMVWGYLLRSCLKCSRTLKEREAKQSAVFTSNPLLTPLVREDSYSTQDIAVAAAEVPRGSYYVPQGSQYVRVAYAPLTSEQ